MNEYINSVKEKRYNNVMYFMIYDILTIKTNKKAKKWLLVALAAALVLALSTLEFLTVWGMLVVFIIAFIFVIGLIENQRLRYIRTVVYYDKYHKAYREPGSKSRWMTEEDMDAAIDRFDDINDTTDFIIGKDTEGRLCVAKKLGASYTAIFAPTGLGKGTDHMLPRHLQAIAAGRSIYSSSTKDDNFRETAAIARAMGYKIKCIVCDPNYLNHSDSVNYLALITGDDSQKTTLAHTLAQVMLDNTPNPVQDFWYEGAENALACMMLLYAENEAIPEAERNIGGIYRFLSEHTDVDEFCAFMDMYITVDHPAYEAYSFFKTKKGGSETVKLQTLQGLGYKLRALQSDQAKAIVSIDDVDLSLPGKEKCIYYVISSADINPYTFIASMFFTMSFTALNKAARDNGGKLAVPVDFLFDELKAVGTIPKFEETIDTIRAIGVRMTLCTQSITQLDDLYGTNARISILNNCAVQILINTSDDDTTAKHFSNLAGKCQLYKYEDGKKVSREADLFPIDWATHMTDQECFVYLQGRKGVLMLTPQRYWDNYPGSKVEIYNDFDGKYYHAHPLLKYRKRVSIAQHTPLWRKKKMAAKKKKQEMRQQAQTNAESASGYEFEEA